jgi:hypothetical protein
MQEQWPNSKIGDHDPLKCQETLTQTTWYYIPEDSNLRD